jgi:glycine oxidase
MSELDVQDIVIVGGGIIGLACARELALAGMRVEVLERLEAGAAASLAAAGMLSPLAELAPGPLLEACRASRDLWLSWVPALYEETGLSIEHDASGSLLVALDEEEETWLDEVAEAATGMGEITDGIELSVLARLVPDISPAVRRALLVHGDHRVDNVQACTVLAIAAQRAGAKLTYGGEVERVERAGGGVRIFTRDRVLEAGRLVLAAGAWSGRIPGLPELPVRPVRGQMLLVAGVSWPWSGCLRGRHLYSVRRGETGLLVGATVEEAGFAVHPTVAGIGGLLAFAQHTLPGLAEARLETVWAGLRPGTPDDLPILGEIPGWPVIAATGHFRNGILLAPWTARAVARLILSGEAPEAAPFHPERFRIES